MADPLLHHLPIPPLDSASAIGYRLSAIGYWLFSFPSSSRPLSEPCSIGVDNDGKDDNATGDHLPHKISNAHQD
jgi:hypothetical protein